MSCADIERRVALYAGGDMDNASARDVERHLATCEACRDVLTALRAQREAMAVSLATAPSQADLDDVRRGVLAAIARGDARPGGLGRTRFVPFRGVAWGSAGLAAAALLVFAVWATMPRPRDVEPAPIAAAPQSHRPSQPAAAPAPHTTGAAPAPAEQRAEVRGETMASATRPTAAAQRPSIVHPRQEAARSGAAGVSLASGSREVMAEVRTAAETSNPQAGPVRRIEFQTADPNIRIIWLVPALPPDPGSSGVPSL